MIHWNDDIGDNKFHEAPWHVFCGCRAVCLLKARKFATWPDAATSFQTLFVSALCAYLDGAPRRSSCHAGVSDHFAVDTNVYGSRAT